MESALAPDHGLLESQASSSSATTEASIQKSLSRRAGDDHDTTTEEVSPAHELEEVPPVIDSEEATQYAIRMAQKF
jgi:hypothetical protein